MDVRKKAGWLLTLVGCVIGFVGLWHWALFGMSQPVQAAAASTAGVIATVGLLLATMP